MKFNKIKVAITIVFVFLIACMYSMLYVYANNDNVNNLKNYQVGVINFDKGLLGSDWIAKLQKQKHFKIKSYSNKSELKNDLSSVDKIQLGIIIKANFSQVLKNPNDFKRKTGVEFVENSKISQMSILANNNIVNSAKVSLNDINALTSAPLIADFIRTKINTFKLLSSEIATLSHTTGDLNADTTNKILKYQNLINNYKVEFSRIKKDVNIEGLKNSLSKLKTLDFSWLKNLNTNDLINKLASDSKINLNDMVAKINNVEVKNILNNYLSDVKSNLDVIVSDIGTNSTPKNLNIKELITKFNQLYQVFTTNINQKLLTDSERIIVNKLSFFKDQLDLFLSTLNTVDFSNLDKLISEFQNLDQDKLVKQLFNVDLKQINSLVSEFSNEQNQKKLSDKLLQLREGLNSLQSGIDLFASKLQDANAKIDFTTISKNAQKLYLLAQEPGKVKIRNITTPQTTGQGIIPFALMLGIWVLSLFTYELFIVNEKLVWKQILYPTVILTIFSIVHLFFVKNLNVNVANSLIYILIINLIGWTFYQIQLFFYNLLKEKAPVILTLIFILMIVGSGATVPIELMGGFYNFIYKFDPLHFCVNLIREINFSPNYATIISNLLNLGYYFITFISLNFLYSILKRRNNNA